MYCSKCGEELSDKANFCQGCGNKIGSESTSDENRTKENTPNFNIIGILQDKSIQYFISIGLSLAIIFLSFGKWLRIRGLSYILDTVSGDVTLYQAIKTILSLNDLISGYVDTSDTIPLLIMVLLLGLMYIIPFLNILYCYKLIRLNSITNTKIFGANTSVATAVLCIVFIGLVFFANKTISDSLGDFSNFVSNIFEIKRIVYFMIGVSVVNYLIIPYVDYDDYYYIDGDPNTWYCVKCTAKNPISDISCRSCGHYR